MSFTKMTGSVMNVSALDNKPTISANELKGTFDSAGLSIKTFINSLIDEIMSQDAAGNIGANVTSVATKTLAAILTEFESRITNRYTKSETDTLLDGKVDKVTGKGLSTNDYDNAEKGNVASNTTARHTHSNKTVLDDISSTDINNWNNKLDSFTEIDPTVPSWAKASTKPSYAYNEITDTPALSTVATSGSYNDLSNKPTIPSIASDVGALPNTTTIPTKISDLTNDSGFIATETDPTVPSWAKQVTKPIYTASEVGAVAGTGITSIQVVSDYPTTEVQGVLYIKTGA